ncbi:Y-family DNA polymerase [Streptococcus caprae]|uniref:Y-family DNA polymerase n=1 Tax=Streptococcus caprae TaxID=1640501 RepID=A0ABV8CVJ3_9STRE
MRIIDYSREPVSDIAFIDMKSFYASVECVDRGLHPLRTSLCVMSRADHSAGLILASSPLFKKIFGQSNVGRAYDLPFDIETRRFSYEKALRRGLDCSSAMVQFIETWAKQTLIVPPRMDRYIEKNLEIQKIFANYASPEDILPYSIDEGFIDLTGSLNYFIPGETQSRKTKLDRVSSMLQREIWDNTRLIATVGMSNSNPLLAKLALDNEAKKTKTMRANWSYSNIENTVWAIPELTDFWGIGQRTALRLQKLGIHTVRELAHANPDLLQKEFGLKGVQLWFHANGVDESNVHQPYQPKSHSIGNSQILPKDYLFQKDIELVIREMAEQVAIRLRRQHQKATVIHLHVGYAKSERKRPMNVQQTIEPTQQTKELIHQVTKLFRHHYKTGAVRQIGISYGGLTTENYSTISLFEDYEQAERYNQLEATIDDIRDQFGFLAIQKGSTLLNHSRAIARSRLTGGHSAGGLEGLR